MAGGVLSLRYVGRATQTYPSFDEHDGSKIMRLAPLDIPEITAKKEVGEAYLLYQNITHFGFSIIRPLRELRDVAAIGRKNQAFGDVWGHGANEHISSQREFRWTAEPPHSLEDQHSCTRVYNEKHNGPMAKSTTASLSVIRDSFKLTSKEKICCQMSDNSLRKKILATIPEEVSTVGLPNHHRADKAIRVRPFLASLQGFTAKLN